MLIPALCEKTELLCSYCKNKLDIMESSNCVKRWPQPFEQDAGVSASTVIVFRSYKRFTENFNKKKAADGALEYMKLYGTRNRKWAPLSH